MNSLIIKFYTRTNIYLLFDISKVFIMFFLKFHISHCFSLHIHSIYLIQNCKSLADIQNNNHTLITKKSGASRHPIFKNKLLKN